MGGILEPLERYKESILKGEIGALLHDIGKCHPDFIRKQSLEGGTYPRHDEIESFLKTELVDLIKDSRFAFEINNHKVDIYSLIRKHHYDEREFAQDVQSQQYKEFILLIESCDKLDSADDKGIVRKKQPAENTVIASPFGHRKQKIDLNFLKKKLEDLENNLIDLFKSYLKNALTVECFRMSIITDLRKIFPHALGETRIPANDVTLWDHSYSTAALFKSALAGQAFGEKLEPENMRWRIFGISWDGIGFVYKGGKIADILRRKDIIEDIKREIQNLCEIQYPIGNMIYEDLNGIYFTFPGLDDNADKIAEELSRQALKIINEKSENEIWPLFTLSKKTRSLTIIVDELAFAEQKRKIPKTSPALYVEGYPKYFENPELPEPAHSREICPVCRMRPKDKDKERCDVCSKRNEGRLAEWLSNRQNNRQNTIWIDEVADINNRIALISLNFNLEKWLDGTMTGTIFSQSFEDWIDEENDKLNIILTDLKQRIKKELEKIDNAINGMKQSKNLQKAQQNIEKGLKDKSELEQILKRYDFPINADKKTCYNFLNIFFEDPELFELLIFRKNNFGKEIQASIFSRFFQNITIEKEDIDHHISNIKQRLGNVEFNKENLAAYLFTKNPSPARLYRIWNETEEFFDIVTREIKTYYYGWKRAKFNLDNNTLHAINVDDKTPYIIKIKGMEPDNILVFHNENGEFYTIESLKKFKFNGKTGETAVQEALKTGFDYLAKEDDASRNLNPGGIIKPNNDIKFEDYAPYIGITKSPLSLRLLVPAQDSMEIIELITKLYNDKFENVLGKLALNIKLLVANRKFPLYILLDSEKRMLEGDDFKKAENMKPWWNIIGIRNDKYYGFYPIKPINGGIKYTLDDLKKISRAKSYSLYPGYFDFDFLGGTSDRYKIRYDYGARTDDEYKLYSNRPYYLYRISEMIELWDILSGYLSTSQIGFIEEMLANKLREWRDIKDKDDVFRKFAEAALKDAFGTDWNDMSEGMKNFLIDSACDKFLLDTVGLFKHILKIREVS